MHPGAYREILEKWGKIKRWEGGQILREKDVFSPHPSHPWWEVRIVPTPPPRSVRLGLQKGIFMKNKREVGKQDVLIFLHN